MPLSLSQIKIGAIVDWNIEWREKGQGRWTEHPRNPIKRGMIVRVEGDPTQETVQEVYATFGEGVGKDKFEFNGVVTPMIKVEARELNLVWDSQDRRAREAWNRTFRVADQIGATFESRTAKGQRPKLSDPLNLTGAPAQGPIADAAPPLPLVVADTEEK